MGATMDKLKGKMKKAEGKVTNDPLREAQGSVEETKGEVEGAIARTKRRARARIDEARAKRAAKKASR